MGGTLAFRGGGGTARVAGPKGQWWEGEGLCHAPCDRDLVQGHTWPRAASGSGVGGLSPPRTPVVVPVPGQAHGKPLGSPCTCLNKCVWMDSRPPPPASRGGRDGLAQAQLS